MPRFYARIESVIVSKIFAATGINEQVHAFFILHFIRLVDRFGVLYGLHRKVAGGINSVEFGYTASNGGMSIHLITPH